MMRRVTALVLAEVMAISSMLWAAPPQPRFAGPPPNPVPYTFEEPTIVKLARAYEEMLEAASAIETESPPVAAPAPTPPAPPPPPAGPVAAFAFGADDFTLPGFVKVVQDGPNFLYDAGRGYGYTDVDGLDGSPNDRNVLSGDDELYDQFIGAKPGGEDIVFRIDVPDGTYRFVAAGGDAKYGNHETTVRVRDGATGATVTLVEDFRNPDCEFWRTGFDGKAPPDAPVLFAPLASSPTLTVTGGFVEVVQIAGPGFAAGGDLTLLELWEVEPAPPPPEDLVAAFTFGADAFTLSPYTKVVQGGANFLYSAGQGFGYSDISGLDTSPNNRGVLSGDAEMYDQFIGAKPGGSRIVFRVDLPNGFYRLVAAGGDARYGNHETSLHVRDGSDGGTHVLVDGLRNPQNEFFQIGFDDKRPPTFPGVNFVSLSTSPLIEVTNGFLEVHQIAGEGFAAGGDLSLLEIWEVAPPPPPPEDLVAAFAFGADSFTVSPYTKIVQDGPNFEYTPARGFGYSDLSGLDTSRNNRGILSGDAEIYDQFIGAKPGGSHIVFRVDVPPGEYRFVAAGGDIRYTNHKTTIRVSDGSATPISLVEDIENPANEFYRVGFDDRHAPSAAGVNFLPEVTSPTLSVTQGYIEVHQWAGEGFAAGGDLSLLQIWSAGTVVPPPTVTIEFPAEGTFHASSAVPVRVSATNADTLQVLVDGIDRSSELIGGTGTLDVPDGLHNLRAVATNVAGSASATHTFTVDTEAPVLTLDPVPEYTATSPLTVTGTLLDRDPDATLDCPAEVLTPIGVNEWSFTCAFPLTEGANTLTVTASDTGGRQASASASTTLDTVAPELTILSPTPDFYTNVDTISVSGGVFDDSPVTVTAGALSADVTGTSFNASGVVIQNGSNLISIVATDAAGNTASASVDVVLDTIVPSLQVAGPSEGAVVDLPVIPTGTVTDAIADPAAVRTRQVRRQNRLVDLASAMLVSRQELAPDPSSLPFPRRALASD